MVGLLLVALAAAPPAPLPELSAPLGHIGAVVEEVPKGGLPGDDKPLVVSFPGCGGPAQAVYPMRFLGGTARAVEQLQQWLERTPGLEKRLFGRKDVLAEVVRQLTDSRLEPQRACTAPAVTDGFRLELTAPPPKWCPAEGGQTTGDFWFFSKGRPSAVVNVLAGAPDACKPRLSTVLFDAKGQARLRYHADWGGAVSATLVGARCQVLDFAFDASRQVFTATLKSCKR